MRLYRDLNEAWNEIKRDVCETGVWNKGHSYQDKVIEGDDDFDYMELAPYVWSVSHNGSEAILDDFIDSNNLNRDWIDAEFSERIMSVTNVFGWSLNNRCNPGDAWKIRRNVWEEFLEFDEMGNRMRFSYTYSEMFGEGNQLSRVITELTEHPQSRQAILSMHHGVDELDSLGGKHRIPCSMFYQFLRRHGRLNLIYVMRSCDIFLHFPYDIVLAIKMQNWIADRINTVPGIFTHSVSSLHGYRRDLKEVF